MGLLIFVWGIYTELEYCMYQTAHGPCLSQSLFVLAVSQKSNIFIHKFYCCYYIFGHVIFASTLVKMSQYNGFSLVYGV